MACTVINGAVGCSPAIEKINRLSTNEMETKAAGQIEQLVFGSGGTGYPTVSCSFETCRETMRKQLYQLHHREEADRGRL